jgi:hypothetical protein
VSAITAASCCCEPPGIIWWADICPEWFDSYCCEPCCESGVTRIEFCEWYLKALGIPLSPDPDTCYVIGYQGCAFVLTNFYTAPCPPPSPTYPTNVGVLIATFPKGEEPCCRPDPSQANIEPGGIADLSTGEGPVILPPAGLCEDTVAECYTYDDQFGTVNPVKVSSNATGCFNEWGVPYNLRCDTNRPETYASMSVLMEQDVGLCYDRGTHSGVVILSPLAPNASLGWYEYTKLEYAVCPDCFDALQCCAEDPYPDPCASIPGLCSSEVDASESYSIETKYAVNQVLGDYYIADALEIVFSACYAQQAGLDITDPADFAAIEALYFGKVTVTNINDCTINTGWGIKPATCIEVCDYLINVYSGDAQDISDRITQRLNPLVTANWLNQWFWFGNRQGCFDCGDGPNVQPPASEGDYLFVDRIVINVPAFTVSVILTGRSQRWRACACQKLSPYSPAPYGIVQNAAVSTNTLSPAEYSAGTRYTMARVYEPAGGTQSICIDTDLNVDVPTCIEVPGYPLNNVYDPISGLLLVEGWNELCGGLFCLPQTTCNNYPFIYDVCPCDDLECQLIPCVEGMFRATAVFCQTAGDVIQID